MKQFVQILVTRKKGIWQTAGAVLLASAALAAVMAYLAASANEALAQGTVRYVAASGSDAGDCANSASPCATIQYAVDQAQDGDEIRAAAGVYTGVTFRDSITQMVYISKSVTIRGGYSLADWNNSYPVTNVTQLDAQNQGRVIVVKIDYPSLITVTIEGVALTGGNATGLGPGIGSNYGGGVYISNYGATTISKTVIYSNTASAASGRGGGVYGQNGAINLINNTIHNNQAGGLVSYGGGVYLTNPGESELLNNTIRDNTAGGGTLLGRGGGIYIAHNNNLVTVTLDSNSIGNNTAGANGAGEGGGLYLTGDSVAVIQNNTIQENIAGGDGSGKGGGIYVNVNINDPAVIRDNLIISNTAGITSTGSGGGVFLTNSDSVTLQGNAILSNTAVVNGAGDYGLGGGVHLVSSAASLLTNTIQGNVAARSGSIGRGGGVHLNSSPALLQGNVISDNTAGLTTQGEGGGVYLLSSNAALQNNTIISNTASVTGAGDGGGIYAFVSQIAVENNIVQDNIAGAAASTLGGGIYLNGGDASFFRRNQVTGNTADEGGGLYIWQSSPLTLTNNLVAGNQASSSGSGLKIRGTSLNPASSVFLLHNTVADNTGAGQGLYVGSYITAILTNTIFAGQAQGIYVESGSVASLEATLWHNNGVNTDGPGAVTTGTINIYGDPSFVNPANRDYHLGTGSAAIDKGIEIGVTDDLDGDNRPYAASIIPDIGADEAVNQHPAANAGPDQTVDSNTVVTLDGSASSNPTGGSLVYDWAQTGGPAVSLSSAAAVSPTFTAPSSTAVLTFTLTVTNSFGLANTDTTVIFVNQTQNWLFLPVIIKEP